MAWLRRCVLVVSTGAMLTSCALVDAFGEDDGPDDQPAICSSTFPLGDVGRLGASTTVDSCNLVNEADLGFACRDDTATNTTIFELDIVAPGEYTICIDTPFEQRFVVAPGFCDGVAAGACAEDGNTCAGIILDTGPLTIYWEPVNDTECGMLDINIFSSDAPPN